MVDLVLHPGHSKCGSTTIQDFLYANREIFKKRGVFLPDLNFNFPCHDEYNFTFTHTSRDYFAQVQSGSISIDELSKKLDDLIKNAKEMGCRRVIISAENLINGIASKNTKAIHQLFADRFNNIRIVYYVRRQDSLMQAAWQQWGHKDGLNLDAYIEKMSKTRFADFYFIARHLKKYYPTSKLHVFPMISEYFIDNNLLVDFCSRALIDKTNLNFKVDTSNTGISSALCDSLAKIQNVYENKHDQNIKNTLINAAPNAAPLLTKKYNNDLSDESKIKLFEKFETSNVELHKSFFPTLPFEVMSLRSEENDSDQELLLLKRKIEKLEDLNSIQMDMILQLLKKGN